MWHPLPFPHHPAQNLRPCSWLVGTSSLFLFNTQGNLYLVWLSHREAEAYRVKLPGPSLSVVGWNGLSCGSPIFPSDILLHSLSRLGTSCQSTHQPFHLACMCTFLVLTPAFPSGLLAGGLGEKATQQPATNSRGLAEEARQLAWGPVIFSGHLAQGSQPFSRCLGGEVRTAPLPTFSRSIWL